MSLSSNVQARYSTQRLRQLTNDGDQSATAIDTTVLGYACTDVEADFLVYAGLAYDDSTATHVSVAVEGVLAKLRMRMDSAGSSAKEAHDSYVERLRSLHLITGGDRVTPTTNSELYPSDENPDNVTTLRPAFDDDHFDDLIPEPPD